MSRVGLIKTSHKATPHIPKNTGNRVAISKTGSYALIVVTTVFAVSGCTSSNLESIEDRGAQSQSSAQLDPDAAPLPVQPDEETTLSPSSLCTPNLKDEIKETVRGQNAAINQRDYAKALEYSSDRYRSGTTPEMFGRMIEAAYQYLLDPGEYPLFDCYVYDGPPRQVVAITAQFGETLLAYYLVKEDDQWRIDLAGGTGAAPSQAPEA